MELTVTYHVEPGTEPVLTLLNLLLPDGRRILLSGQDPSSRVESSDGRITERYINLSWKQVMVRIKPPFEV